jgi:hypothetical protein
MRTKRCCVARSFRAFTGSRGYQGAYLLRRVVPGEVEFVTLTMFESLDAVRAFAGVDYEAAVVPPPARALLARFDQRSIHSEVRLAPSPLTEP